jgi:CRP/FNR family cyclic AMP-dependent transcriptional regulator
MSMPLPFQMSDELFRGIPDGDARKIRDRCSERQFPPGAAIFYEGDPANALCIVKAGLVKLVSLSENGTDSILHILRPGEIFGELIVCDAKRPFSAVALLDVTVTILQRKDLLDLFSSFPLFLRNFLEMLSRRLLRVERDFADLLNAWAYHRLARELLHLAEDLGVETSRGTLIPLHLTHEDLSNLIGTARETVTIQLHKFEEMGLILRKGRRIIVNRPRVERYLSFEET